jgi:hypothetical protein
MKRMFFAIIIISLCISLYANHLFTVDNPTCGILSKGEARIFQKVYKNNGMLVGTEVGLFDNFSFGVAYGAEQLVGEQEPEWHNTIDFFARFRIIQESIHYPAFAIGINTLGHGTYYNDKKRYDIKSKGAYIVASKNYSFMGLIGFDAGVNYTFEDETDFDNTNFDIFTGVYKTIGQNLTFFADYSFALNDKEKSNLIGGDGKGYLNAAIEMKINEQLSLKLLLHDLLKNKPNNEIFDRSLLIDYRWFF